MQRSSAVKKITVTILGLFLCLITLEIGLRIVGFAFLSRQEHRNVVAIKQRGAYRIMCLGESMTAGMWPRPLEGILNKKTQGIRFAVIDKAKPGTNSDFVVSTLKENLDRYNPDMVMVMMGINDGKELLPYGNIPTSKEIPFKICKLAMIFWYHVVNKARDETNSLSQPDNFKEQERVFKKVIELNPKNAEAYIKLACFYKDRERFGQAEEMFKKALEINSKSDRAFIELGWYYRDQVRFKKAEEMFKKALEINPENDEAYIGLGMFKKALEINPENDEACIKLAWSYAVQKRFKEAEEMFKKAIEVNPQNDRPYVELGWFYRDRRRFKEGKEMFKKAVEINPENGWLYDEVSKYFCQKHPGRFAEAEEMFQRAREQNPENDWPYTALACFYRDQGRFETAEEMFKKAIEVNPQNDRLYTELRWHYKYQGKSGEVAEMYRRAIKTNLENNKAYAGVYMGLGRHYEEQEKYKEAAAIFKKGKEIYEKVIEMNPGEKVWAYIGLGRYYKTQGRYKEAEKIFRKVEGMYKKVIEMNPKDDKTYGKLALLYKEQGKYSLAEEYFNKANRLRLETYNPITRRNYERLREILTQREIRLVCVQYPVLSALPLKKMFNNREGIIFVDNERVFKEALKEASYDEYFKDIFGGDFGHCTPKGNRLLAENIADVILRECF